MTTRRAEVPGILKKLIQHLRYEVCRTFYSAIVAADLRAYIEFRMGGLIGSPEIGDQCAKIESLLIGGGDRLFDPCGGSQRVNHAAQAFDPVTCPSQVSA